MNAPLAIDVHGLEKRFGPRTVVKDLSIQVPRGQICGFLGPNGSGKTTTIRLLCGLLTPDAGEGTCLGLDIRRDAAAIRRQVGYMTQRFSLYEDLSIRENLEFVARMYSVPARAAAVDAALADLGLVGRQHQLAGTLSGGWKQRLALAACVLHRPQLLLLDEPTAGVDPKARREFWDRIHLLAAGGLTVLVIYYMDEAERCHAIAYIAYGRILARGTVEEVVSQSGLTTWRAMAPDPDDLSRRLQGLPGVDMVVRFGSALHVSGADPAALEAALAPFRTDPAITWQKSEPSLEDVFIGLMASAKDELQ